ncbi:hypothetical protein D3C77_472520 [compost metagenome]
MHRPSLAIAANAGGLQAPERAALGAEQVGVGRHHRMRVVNRIRALDPQRPVKDRRQRRFQLGQFGGIQGLRGHLILGKRVARQRAAVPRRLASVQKHPACVSQAMARAGIKQQFQMLGGGQPDQTVQRLHGFLEYRRPRVQQKARRPAQVPGQIRRAIAELHAVVLHQPGQLPPQTRVIERHQ